MGETIDIIATRILLESQQATKALADFNAGVGKSKSQVENLARAIRVLKAETGRSTQDLVKMFQGLNNPKGTNLFGNLGLNKTQIAEAGKIVTLYEQQAAAKTKVAAAAERAAAAEAKQKVAASLPQNTIPQFVQKNFGNINDYIAQSADKVAAWKRVVQGSAQAAGVSFEQAGTQLKKMVSGTTVAPLNTALKQLGDDGRSSFQKLIDGAHFARIALGALVSMLLFQAINAVTQFFSTAVQQAKQFEETLYRIQNAERQLSQSGIEVSTKGLLKGVQDLQKAFPIFSKEDIAELVGGIAVTTKELGYTEDQILKLAAASLILNKNSVQQETILQTQAQVTNSLVSPMAKSIGNLGLAFGKNKIEAKALEMQILKTGESFDDLTEKEKSDVKFQIVLDTAGIENLDDIAKLKELIEAAGGDFEALNNLLDTNASKIDRNKAAWADFAVTFGLLVNTLIPDLTGFFKFLEDSLNRLNFMLLGTQATFGGFASAVEKVGGLKEAFKDAESFQKILKEEQENLFADLAPKLFPEVPEGYGFTELLRPYIQHTETATAAVKEFYDEQEDNEDAKKALEEIDDKIKDIILDAKQAGEDLKLKRDQKETDINTEYDRKGLDAARDHARKLDDINLDAIRKAEDAKRKSREDEKKAERDLLQKLKELRDKFLMDLEDALHERDARQVLRLIREYKMDKQHLLERKKLDDQERKDKLAEDLKAIEIERQRRIADENIDYQRKLADLAAAKQREQEELALWYQREQEDIQRNIQQRLEKLLAGYIEEGRITAEQQDNITAILAQAFANNMALVDQMVAFMQQRFAMMGQMGAFFGGVSPSGLSMYQNSEWGSSGGSTGGRSGRRFAKGGTMIADRPTTVTFGEGGLEAATFTPLDKSGRDVNKLFGDLGGSMGGGLQLGIMLSPELRAEIINTTLDKVALTVEHVRRERS